MSGIGFWEMIFLCMIGLVILGPKRLPQVANQLGTWVGQARRMTRVMKRQLEEELDFDSDLSVRPTIHPPPRDDDDYSPLHEKPRTSLNLNEPGDEEAEAAPADTPAAEPEADVKDRDERQETDKP